MNTQGRFMIMGLTGLVLNDLVGAIGEKCPTLSACIATDEADAITQIGRASDWRYVILNMGPDALAASPLWNLLGSAGAHIVLMGNEAEDACEKSPCPVLIRPFAAQDIFAALSKRQEAQAFQFPLDRATLRPIRTKEMQK